MCPENNLILEKHKKINNENVIKTYFKLAQISCFIISLNEIYSALAFS